MMNEKHFGKLVIAALIGVIGVIDICSAVTVNHPWHTEKTFIEEGRKVIETSWKYVQKGWRPKMREGATPEGRFEPYSDYLDKWTVVHTNDVINICPRKSRSKFQDKIDEMELGYQKQKKLDQAAKKWSKNIEKVRKEFEKNISKAGTEEEREFWQALLDTLPTPNEGK